MDFVLIAQEFSWLSPASWWAIAQVVLGLGFVIFVHELGHFLVAKACGVKCEKFYVGFDAFDIKVGDLVLVPRALLKWKWGETEYGIGIVPLGGYVKMLGQDDNPSNIESENKRSQVAGESVDASPLPLDKSQIDPRSYLAKSVPQRMAIISAGVVFNLIFAVIFAAWAFRVGVDYTPAVVGSTVGGSPAWEANLSGSKILRIGNKRMDEGYVPFIDLAQEFALNGPNPVEIEYQRFNETTVRTATVTPRENLRRDVPIALIGVDPMITSTLVTKDAINPGSAASQATPPFANGDQIVAIDGVAVSNLLEMAAELASKRDQAVTMTVVRTDDKKQENKIDIQVPPNPLASLGFWFEWGAVTSIQVESPAATAGIQVGDRIVKIDGQPVGDLLTVDQRMTQLLRDNKQSVVLTIERSDNTGAAANNLEIEIQPRQPRSFARLGEEPFIVDSWGIAIPLLDKVAGVEANSDVATKGLVAGDRILGYKVTLAESEAKLPRYEGLKKDVFFEPADRGWLAGKSAKTEVTEFLGLTQILPASTIYELAIAKADGASATLTTTALPSPNYFVPTRGLLPKEYKTNYQSASVLESLQLGARQTWSDMTRIGQFLGKLVSGQISATNLGGPGTIAMVATSEASAGTSRLLLFLTMLSANLAIVNFLPIPILDGGHIMFLLYEGILRRPVTEKVQILLSYGGLLFILSLMVFVLFLDFSRITGFFQ